MRLLPLACGVLLTAVALAVPQVAHAQGNGRPKTGRSSTDTTTATAAAATPLTTYPQFGAWLDDASALGTGDGAVSIGAGFWRLDGMTQSNIPMLGGGIGVTDRMQVSASVPFYRVSAPSFSAHGLDDVYLSAKYMLLDPTLTVSKWAWRSVPSSKCSAPTRSTVACISHCRSAWNCVARRSASTGPPATSPAAPCSGVVRWSGPVKMA